MQSCGTSFMIVPKQLKLNQSSPTEMVCEDKKTDETDILFLLEESRTPAFNGEPVLSAYLV